MDQMFQRIPGKPSGWYNKEITVNLLSRWKSWNFVMLFARIFADKLILEKLSMNMTVIH